MKGSSGSPSNNSFITLVVKFDAVNFHVFFAFKTQHKLSDNFELKPPYKEKLFF